MDEDHGNVIEHKSDLYTTYDVTDKGYCVNIKPRLAYDVYRDVKKTLEELSQKMTAKYPSLMADMDYFLYSFEKDEYQEVHTAPWPENRWVCIHYVKGGSEGYYVHVSTISDGKYTFVMLAKTLREGEAGISWAEQMVCALSRIMEV